MSAIEREKTRRLYGLLALSAVLVVAIVALYVRGDADNGRELVGLAQRLEGFLTAVVARAALELAGTRAAAPELAPRERDTDPGGQ